MLHRLKVLQDRCGLLLQWSLSREEELDALGESVVPWKGKDREMERESGENSERPTEKPVGLASNYELPDYFIQCSSVLIGPLVSQDKNRAAIFK
jgi:hypothetical protein